MQAVYYAACIFCHAYYFTNKAGFVPVYCFYLTRLFLLVKNKTETAMPVAVQYLRFYPGFLNLALLSGYN